MTLRRWQRGRLITDLMALLEIVKGGGFIMFGSRVRSAEFVLRVRVGLLMKRLDKGNVYRVKQIKREENDDDQKD